MFSLIQLLGLVSFNFFVEFLTNTVLSRWIKNPKAANVMAVAVPLRLILWTIFAVRYTTPVNAFGFAVAVVAAADATIVVLLIFTNLANSRSHSEITAITTLEEWLLWMWLFCLAHCFLFYER